MKSSWKQQRAVMKDRMSRLSPLNRKRLQNAWASYRLYAKNQRGIRAQQAAWPMSLSVEPTTSCNLRCPECPSGLRSFKRPTGMLDLELMKKAMDEMSDYLIYLNLYFQGEPFLHPQMDELVAEASSRGLYTSTSTNAHFLRTDRCKEIVRSGLNRLIISIDGMTQETYAAYRIGGQLEKVIEGTQNMIEARSENQGVGPHLVWQFLVVGPNEHEIETVRAQAQKIGVDELVIKTAQIETPEDGHPLLTNDPNYRRYDRQGDGTWKLRNPFKNECWRMWQGCVMTWDGKIVPCCFDKDAHHSMGIIGETPFSSIWFGEEYQRFRQQIFTHRSQLEMCQNCSEGSHAYA